MFRSVCNLVSVTFVMASVVLEAPSVDVFERTIDCHSSTIDAP